MWVTLIVAFLSLIALMVIHEFGHFIIAKKFKVKIEEFGIGYPPRIFGKKFGETLYSINLIPLGAFVKIYGEEGDIDDYRSFSNLAIWKRILIVLGGVISFWIASMIIFTAAFMIGASVPVGDQDIAGVNDTAVKIVSVANGSPAEAAGIQPGDQLVSAESRSSKLNINKISDFQDFTYQNQDKQIILVLNKAGHEFSVELTPRSQYPSGQGPTGVTLERMANVIKKYPWYEAPFQGIIFTWQTTWQALVGIYGVMASLFEGKGVPQGAELAGPVGITIFLSQAASLGVGFFLYFIGSLSVLLALFNAFPIPALDGGKLLFLIIEAIKRKPVSVKVEQYLTITFFALLILMSIFITIKFDVPRVIDFWQAGL